MWKDIQGLTLYSVLDSVPALKDYSNIMLACAAALELPNLNYVYGKLRTNNM